MAAAAVGASFVALTACSSPMEAGAAAVVGSRRISAADLNRNVREYEAALKKAGVQPSQLPLPMTQFVLLRMTEQSRFEQLARKFGVQVSEAEIDAAAKDPGQAGSPEMNLLAKGVSPGNARAFVRAEVGLTKLADKFGGRQNQQAIAKLTQEYNSIKPVFSPRYGTFDQQRGFLDAGRFGKAAPQDQQQPQG